MCHTFNPSTLMPLVDIPLPELDAAPVPYPVRKFLAEADKRVEEALADAGIPGFVPSDYENFYRTLRAITDASLLRGNTFLEWGSGLGVSASLAAMIGYEAVGIETEWELVDTARQLAEAFDVPVEFIHGSFIPRGHDDITAGEYSWLVTESDDAYPQAGLDPDDFDLIFVYCWPDDEQTTADLFENCAGVGTVLMTFKGGDGYRLRRKVEGKGKKKRR